MIKLFISLNAKNNITRLAFLNKLDCSTNMNIKKSIQFIPLGIASLLAILYFIENNFMVNSDGIEKLGSSISIDIKYLFSFCGLLVTIVLAVLKIDYWKHIFSFILFSAVVHLTQFYHTTFYVSIGFLSIEISSLVLLIAHLKLNKSLIGDIQSFFKKSEEEEEQSNEFKIQFFERKYSNIHSDELKMMINQNNLVPEAIEAARRLIEKREKDNKVKV